MAGANDLTTLPVVQEWLSAESSVPGNSNNVLSRLITQCSAAIMAYLQRSSLLSQTFTDTFDGNGGSLYFLNEWPVTAVQSVTVDGIAVTPSPDGIRSGWVLDAWNGYPPGSLQAVKIIGSGCFDRGLQNVSIVYTAGYIVQKEAQTVPATPYAVQVNQPQGPWAQDAGVVYASTGAALTKVAANPTVGQYALIPSSLSVATGGYQFAAADGGANVLISYSYVPSTVEDAAVNWVSERYRYRQRIGMRSQSQGGQTTVSYDVSDIPAYIKTQLQQYRKVLPL